MDDSDDTLTAPFNTQTFTGALSRDDHSIDVTFAVALGRDGEVAIAFERFVRTETAFDMYSVWTRERRDVRTYVLSGRTNEGTTFESDDIFITTFGGGFRQEYGGFWYQPSVQCGSCEIVMKLTAPVQRTVHRMLLKGFETFPEVRGKTHLGDVVMRGALKPEDHDLILGEIAVIRPVPDEATPEVPFDPAAWRAETDRLMLHVRSIMSFAASVTLRTPVSEFLHGDTSVITCRSQTRQHRAVMRVFHTLDLQPIFDTALRSFIDTPFPVRDLPLAIEWLAMESTYNEVRLMSAMTALENLIDANLEDDVKLLLARKSFDRLRRRMKDRLKEAITEFAAEEDLEAKAVEELQSELGERLIEFNRRSLRAKIYLLADRWQVALDGIDDVRIRAAVRARNFVVHTGQLPEPDEDDPDLWEHYTVVRELMIRFILRALGFTGRYITHLDGLRDATFPPAPERPSA